jgi:hypothetical protein
VRKRLKRWAIDIAFFKIVGADFARGPRVTFLCRIEKHKKERSGWKYVVSITQKYRPAVLLSSVQNYSLNSPSGYVVSL